MTDARTDVPTFGSFVGGEWVEAVGRGTFESLAAHQLLRHRPWGYVLSGTLLVMLAIETTSIGVDQWMGHAPDAASSVASDALTPVFGVLTLIGIVALGLFLRPARRTVR